MITKLLLELVIFIISLFVGIISGLTPELNNIPLIYVADFIAEIRTQMVNFIYFIVGDAFYFFIDIITLFFAFKLIIYPILLLVRRNLTKTE